MSGSKRTYQPVWEKLKKNGKASLRVKLAHLSDELKIVRTIKKAVMKEKYMDSSFKAKFPHSRINFEFDTENCRLQMKLTDYPLIGEDY